MAGPRYDDVRGTFECEASGQNLLQMRMEQLGNISNSGSKAHFNGRFIALKDPANAEVAASVLFDTGALCANYMSEFKFRELRENNYFTDDDIIWKRTNIGLADNATTVFSDKMLEQPMQFQQCDGTWFAYTGVFVILEMKANEVIIGLPAILRELWDFFIENLGNKRLPPVSVNYLAADIPSTRNPREISSSVATRHYDDRHNKVISFALNALDTLRQPWSESAGEECPEEKAVGLPVQFEWAQSFLGKPYDVAVSEYKSMFDDHISECMKTQTPIIELLETKGLDVFVPTSWEGITGLGTLSLEFSQDLPPRMKPKARNINPRMWEDAEKEFTRMRGYFYEESRSPWASCLVIAPKATKPFIRICGDYVQMNKYIATGHYYIPTVRHELDKIIHYPLYLDIDLTNAFHQIPLHANTMDKLSVQTPWGQFKPKFLPEGVGPGSGVLQEYVRKMFSDFEWAVVIFDNILILATDPQDGYQKLETFLDRCIKHNVKLKFSKSWIGFKEVNFFGYHCTHKYFKLTDDRKAAIMAMKFPEDGNRCKKMRVALGCGVFFSPFVPNYSSVTKHLPALTQAKFNWDESSWKHDYRKEFEDFKAALQDSCALFYPDYTKQFIVRTDASEYGVGGILLQVVKLENGNKQKQVIALCSQKFSDPATRWATIEQEGYGIFYSVQKFAYYLRGTCFIIQTDHNNLRWMEASQVPKIIRWRVYLQSFDFLIEHIAGTRNVVADALSRLLTLSHMWDDGLSEEDPNAVWRAKDLMYPPFIEDVEREPEESRLANVFDDPKGATKEITPKALNPMKCQEVFDSMHNSTVGHWGAVETWRRMNKFAPGHGLSQREVAELVMKCANCAKNRREKEDKLVPIVRSLKPPHSRSAIGIDAVEVTPHGKNGQTHIYVVVNLFTKLATLSTGTSVSAENLVYAIWHHWTIYGHTDMIISDLGSDLNSKVFAEIVKLMGMRHTFSIADRHANGSERTIKEVVRHLRAIAYDKRIDDIYDDPLIIPSVQYILNSHCSSETSYSAYELTFGTQDVLYTELLKGGKDSRPQHKLLQRLVANIAKLREASTEHQRALDKERIETQELTKQNLYQKGDYVMFDTGPKPNPKMSSRHRGPYRVIVQVKNDVQVRNLITDAIHVYSVHDLEPFYGDANSAFEAACHDDKQYIMTRVISYAGNCARRTECSFTCEFNDGTVAELTWTRDILCDAFYDFCRSKPYLHHLTLTANDAANFIKQMNRIDITTVKPGDVAYVDLRFFGGRWYESLELPDGPTKSYVMEYEYTHWYHDLSYGRPNSRARNPTARNNFKNNDISGKFLLLEGKVPEVSYAFHWKTYMVFCWGSKTQFDPNTMILVDEALTTSYPRILER